VRQQDAYPANVGSGSSYNYAQHPRPRFQRAASPSLFVCLSSLPTVDY